MLITNVWRKNCELKIRGHLHGVFLFILLFVSGICGNNVYSQEKRLTIEMKEATLGEILEKICQLQNVEFVYNTDIVDVKEKMSVVDAQQYVKGGVGCGLGEEVFV